MTTKDNSTADEPNGDGGSNDRPITQEQMNKLLAAQKRDIEGKYDGFDDIKSKAEQFDALTKSTEQSLAEARAEADAAKAELAQRDVLLQQQEIAASKGLDPKLWSRVKGKTKDEIETDINELLSLSPPARKGSVGFTSGASSGKQLTDKERAVEALRGIRER